MEQEPNTPSHPKPGDALRDQAANLLSVKYGDAITEKRSRGKKVDVYFEYRSLGRKRRLYVECKDYEKHLTRSDLVSIWSDYAGILDRNKPSDLIVITRNGISTDAHEYINEEVSNSSHQTIWQLESDILGLDQYTNSLIEIINENNLNEYYILPRGKIDYFESENPALTLSSNENIDLFEHVLKWVDDVDAKPIAILGGYGAGKTSFAKYIVSHLARKACVDSTSRIPIHIKLGMFTRYSSIESIIAGMFGLDFPVPGFSVPTFLHCNAQGRFVIICDGFDEMKHAMTWADFRSTISEINKLVCENSKIIILGRPNAFLSSDEHVQILRGFTKFGESYRNLVDWPQFEEIVLSEFDNEQRKIFVEKYLIYVYKSRFRNLKSSHLKEIKNRVKKVNNLADLEPDIFSKPVHAKILTELSAEPSFDLDSFKSGLTRWDLYESFFSYLSEREVEKESRRRISESGRMKFISEVAYWLWSQKDGQTAFSVHEMPSYIFSQLDDGDTYEFSSKLREYLTGAFLEKKSGDTYYFGHRSFAEFLVARRLLIEKPLPKDHSHYARILDDSVLDFFVEGIGTKNLESWAETLDSFEGILDIKYLRLLIAHSTSFRAFRSMIRKNSLLRECLECFDDNIVFNQVFERRMIKKIASARETDVYFILQFINLSMSHRKLEPNGMDFSILQELTESLWRVSSLFPGIVKHDSIRDRYLVDGSQLRKYVDDKTLKNGRIVLCRDFSPESDGWPDRFEKRISSHASRLIERLQIPKLQRKK